MDAPTSARDWVDIMDPKNDDERPTVTADEVAKRLTVSRTVIYGLFDSGEIRSVRIGKLRRTCWKWVREYLDKNTTAPPADEPGDTE